MFRSSRSILLAASLLACGVHAACGDELRLLSAAAMQTVFKETAGEFERQSGHRLNIEYATMGAIEQRVMAGETADVVIGSLPSISGLVTAGRLHSQATICKVGIGIVSPIHSPVPQVASVDALVRTLVAARAVVYAEPSRGGAAGIHIARVIEKLGLSDWVKPKTRFGGGGDVTEVTLAAGNGALGMTQISEIVGKPGARFIGPFPVEFQNYTRVAMGIPKDAKPAAEAFASFLGSAAVVAAIKARGMEFD